MKNDQIVTMTESFEGHAQQTENGIEYWFFVSIGWCYICHS